MQQEQARGPLRRDAFVRRDAFILPAPTVTIDCPCSLLVSRATGVQQPTDRQSAVQAFATVRMPSEMESQNRTEQMQQGLPEKAMVRSGSGVILGH